jgi:transcriptional regulator with XRE-family HTH domain
MPRVSRLRLPPLDAGPESIGQRLARLRKERGFTQIEVADKIGIIQSLVFSYENGVLNLKAEMAVRFARALDVGVEELLDGAKPRADAAKPNRRVLRRLERIEALPSHHQQHVLKTIDTLLKGFQRA